ncbi:MAG: hypothetical protein ACLPVY_16100 [Acidimicrobiia bacterium]
MIPDLRPRGVGEILDAAATLYRARFGQLVRYAAYVVVPLQVLLTLVFLSAQPVHFNGTATPQLSSSRAELAATFVMLVVGVLTHAFVAALTTRVVADEYVGYPEPAGQAARTAARRFLAVLGVAVLVGLAELVGLLFCFVGIFAAQALYAVAIPVVILERRSVAAAMGRSWELTKSHLWHVLGVTLSATVLSAMLNLALATALNLWSAHGASPTSLAIAQGIANSVALLLTAPFVAAAIVALYFDLRIRDEAFDVQMALAQ